MNKSSRWIIHLDLDSFYASVEVLDNPALKGRPVIVGGMGPRSVVSTCSYEARAYKVHSGMPSTEARRLCPGGVFLPVRMARYRELSGQVMDIFKRYTPLVEPLALDEAFLDVSGSLAAFGTPPEIAQRIRSEVKRETGLTVSAGVSTVKHIAKIASGFQKPDGLTVIEAGGELAFLRPLDIERLWGVGPVMAKALRALGLNTVGEVADRGSNYLFGRFGNRGRRLWELANAIDPRGVEPDRKIKSLGAEETYAVDIKTMESVKRELLALSVKVAWRMREKNFNALTVSIKVRDRHFKTVTRSKTSSQPFCDHLTLYHLATELFPFDRTGPWRLLGVTVSNLVPAASTWRMGTLFERSTSLSPPTDPRLNQAMDTINHRFGDGSLTPATLLESANCSDDQADDNLIDDL
ncbi:MAG: DNA polymerase IV [Deltaproteobacteria bacterium]|jgi:DNA polymerase-4|nr:DNA polymerase IV [Deltaproteobacteria bacterium]